MLLANSLPPSPPPADVYHFFVNSNAAFQGKGKEETLNEETLNFKGALNSFTWNCSY